MDEPQWEAKRRERTRQQILLKFHELLQQAGVEPSAELTDRVLARSQVIELEHGGSMVLCRLGDEWLPLERCIEAIVRER